MMRRVVSVVLVLVGLLLLVGCERTEPDPKILLTQDDTRPTLELIEAVLPGTKVKLTYKNCYSGYEDTDSAMAWAEVSVPGDAAEIGRKLYGPALARGWVPYEVQEPAVAFFAQSNRSLGVERTPQGTVLAVSLKRSDCSESTPARPAHAFVGKPVVTDTQRAAGEKFAAAVEPALAEINVRLPARTGTADFVVARNQSLCEVGTPQVGLTPTAFVTGGHVAAPPETWEGLTGVFASVLEARGWRRDLENDAWRTRWVKDVDGVELRVEADLRSFSQLGSIFVAFYAKTPVCVPYERAEL